MLGGDGDEVGFMPVVFPSGRVSVSSLGYFSSVGSSYKSSHTSPPISLRVHRNKYYFKKKRGRTQK